MPRRLLFALTLALATSACTCASPQPPVSLASGAVAPRPPPNFLLVHEGLYRGGHPDEAAFAHLAALGVKTIVDLEIDDGIEATGGEIDAELAAAKARGMRVVRAPISAFEPALSDRFDRLVQEALFTMRDPAAQPVYVHCKHGQDRTGLVIGLHRVQHQAWLPKDAWAEMLSIGFHPQFLGLKHYFHRKTGWEP